MGGKLAAGRAEFRASPAFRRGKLRAGRAARRGAEDHGAVVPARPLASSYQPRGGHASISPSGRPGQIRGGVVQGGASRITTYWSRIWVSALVRCWHQADLAARPPV